MEVKQLFHHSIYNTEVESVGFSGEKTPIWLNYNNSAKMSGPGRAGGEGRGGKGPERRMETADIQTEKRSFPAINTSLSPADVWMFQCL